MSRNFIDVQVGEIIRLQNDKKAQLKSSEYSKSGHIPIVDQSSNFICGYTDDESKKYSKSLPVVVFGDHTLHTKYIDFDFAVGADGTQILKPQREAHDTKYLYYVIQRETQLMGSEGYKRHLKILKERIVPFYEDQLYQQKIASILTSVDDVIEKTQSQINKLQDLKKGTMNELLTRGIGHTEFKDSPVGWIPREWDVNQLGDLGRFKNGLNKGKEDFGFGTLFVNISDAYPERLQCNSLSRLNANERDLKEYGLTNGDIIFVRSSVKPEGVGYPTLFRGHDEEVVYCGFMIRYRFDKDILYPEFLVYALKQERFRREVMKVATISANTNINQDALSKLFISIPTQEEQQKIASILSSIDKNIEEKQRKLQQTKFLKKSLMNDLLTGKVRVSV